MTRSTHCGDIPRTQPGSTTIRRIVAGKTARRIVAGAIAVAALGLPIPHTEAGDLDRAIQLVLKMNTAAAQSQKKVDKLDDQKTDLLNEFRAVQQQMASIRDYNAQVQSLVDAQETQANDLQRQIDDATSVGRGVTPMMLRMIESLKAFVDLDAPFLLEERRSRVTQLEKLMARADVTEAEKYRRITEAYQIENEYGRTIEAYRGTLEGEGSDGRTVEFLRVGRVVLVYRTFDGEELGVWDQTNRKWVPLGADYKKAIKDGFRIARKQAAPNLFRVPVAAPQKAQEATP
ncbi:MAG: DUF3450 domain-containing protein [Deltaproteobacteria bacterium]|jgi:hypothetical protein